jgi:phospholipase/lecithinase/hemolysin
MKTCLHRGLVGFALTAACSLPLSAAASLTQLTNLFVFGDSLSDGGNSGLLTQQAAGVVFPPPPYAGGRYSNGLTAVEYLWNSYNPGNPGGFAPSIAGGTNYAIGGATTGTANFNAVNPGVPDPLKPVFANFGNAWQLQQFATAAPAFDPATSLFVVWLFPNDVFAASAGLPAGTVPGSPGGPDLISNGIANILTTIQTLTALGARHFLVPNMPDLGDTPAFLGDAFLSGLTALFNANLGQQLTLLDQFLPSEIVQFDTAAAFDAILQNPGAYGFNNWTQGCVSNFGFGSGQCNPTNWDTWLFWDGVHPTTATHRLLGAQFAAAVPEPASIVLIAAGLVVMVWRRRARRN